MIESWQKLIVQNKHTQREVGMIFMGILIGATIATILFLILVLKDNPEKRKKVLEFLVKAKNRIVQLKLWRHLRNAIGIGLVFFAIGALVFYKWEWVQKTTTMPEGKWYEFPILWVAGVFVLVLGLLALLLTRLKPGYAETKESKDDGKDAGDKDKEKKGKDGKDGKVNFFANFKETWYGATFIYTVMVIGLYAFITWGMLSYMQPLWWKWLWTDQRTIFYFIPLTILVSVVAFKFKHAVIMGFGIVMIAILALTIADESGASAWIGNLWKNGITATEVKDVGKPKVHHYKFYWKKPEGVAGRNLGVRGGTVDAIVRKDDDFVFEFVTSHPDDPNFNGRWYWNKTKLKGTWSQLNPEQKGDWTIKETLPDGSYSGTFTDDSFDEGAEGTFTLTPVKVGE